MGCCLKCLILILISPYFLIPKHLPIKFHCSFVSLLFLNEEFLFNNQVENIYNGFTLYLLNLLHVITIFIGNSFTGITFRSSLSLLKKRKKEEVED